VSTTDVSRESYANGADTSIFGTFPDITDGAFAAGHTGPSAGHRVPRRR